MADSLYTSDRMCKVITQNFRAEGNLRKKLGELEYKRKKSILRIIMKTMEIERDIGPLLLPRVGSGKSVDNAGVQRHVADAGKVDGGQTHLSDGGKAKGDQTKRHVSECRQANGIQLQRQVSIGGVNGGQIQRSKNCVGKIVQTNHCRRQAYVGRSEQRNVDQLQQRHPSEGGQFKDTKREQLNVNGIFKLTVWERRRLNGVAVDRRAISSRPRTVFNRPYVSTPQERREINDHSFRELITKYQARKETVYRSTSDYSQYIQLQSFRMPKMTQSLNRELRVSVTPSAENPYRISGPQSFEEIWKIRTFRRRNAVVTAPIIEAPNKVKCAEWLENSSK